MKCKLAHPDGVRPFLLSSRFYNTQTKSRALIGLRNLQADLDHCLHHYQDLFFHDSLFIVFQNIAKLLYDSRELVKSQQFVIDDLKQKLNDAQGDIKVTDLTNMKVSIDL